MPGKTSLSPNSSEFQSRVVQLIRAIPPGCVATYGQVAALAGEPRAARQVGYILHRSSAAEHLPWHRVINRKGEISLPKDGMFQLQKALLRQEGIIFDRQDRIDLQKFGWQPGTL